MLKQCCEMSKQTVQTVSVTVHLRDCSQQSLISPIQWQAGKGPIPHSRSAFHKKYRVESTLPSDQLVWVYGGSSKWGSHEYKGKVGKKKRYLHTTQDHTCNEQVTHRHQYVIHRWINILQFGNVLQQAALVPGATPDPLHMQQACGIGSEGGGAVTLSHYDKYNAPTIGHSNSNRGPLLGFCNMHCRLVRMGILLFIHFLNSTHTIARNWPSTTATTTMAGSNEAGSSGGPFRFFWHDPTSRLGWLRVRLHLVSGRILVPRQAMSA